MESTLRDLLKIKSAKRYNEGKLRYDLLPPKPIEDLVKVFTMGADKYGDNNWQLGMDWSKCLASLKRHLAEYEKGNDFDKESGLLHITHVVWNAMAINQYYYTAQQYDDRVKPVLKEYKIGLDVDDVLAGMTDDVAAIDNINPETILHWADPRWRNAFDKVKDNTKFWETLSVLTPPEKIPFEPHCYITKLPKRFAKNRQKWLDDNNFPAAPLYTVEPGESKLNIAKKAGINLFVDDNFHTFAEMNQNGIPCFLMDAPYNRKYNVGFKRVHSLEEVAQKLGLTS